jgi:hypothetical protein
VSHRTLPTRLERRGNRPFEALGNGPFLREKLIFDDASRRLSMTGGTLKLLVALLYRRLGLQSREVKLGHIGSVFAS